VSTPVSPAPPLTAVVHPTLSLERALDVVSDVFVVFDRDFRLTYHNEANRAAMRVAGMDPDEAIGKYVLDAMPQLAGTVGLRESQRALDERIATEWEESYGPDVRLRGRAYPLADGGIVVAAANVSPEWRASVSAQQALARARQLQAATLQFGRALRPGEVARIALTQGRAALRASAGVVYVLDDATHVLHAMAFDGINADTLAPWLSIPLDSQMMIADAVRAGTPIYLPRRDEALARYPHARDANRHIVPDAWASIPLINDGRTLGGISLGFENLPEFTKDDRAFIETFAAQCAQALDRARLYEDAAGAREAAERANRAKSDFLAAMSHELRTPLNAIGGYADLMAMGLHGPLTPAQQEDLRRIARNQAHLLGIINDILNFASLEAGRVDIYLEDGPVHELIEDVEPLVAPRLGERNLGFVVDTGDPSLHVRADREKARQILLNLLTNACKFTEPGGQIGIRFGAEHGMVHIDVRDTGVGIAPEKLSAIFEPFVQVNRSLAHPTSGTGLGLAISRDLARRMGGDVTVQSNRGAGSTFTLALPRADSVT
jgi:signal transduction histidine kinase